MNSWTEKTWTAIIFNQAIADLMKTYAQIPPRAPQSETFTGEMQIERYRTIEQVKKMMNEKKINLPPLSVDPKQ
ncbi:hypothetical protein D3C86_2174850 [compost metagenome]